MTAALSIGTTIADGPLLVAVLIAVVAGWNDCMRVHDRTQATRSNNVFCLSTSHYNH